MAKHRLIGKEVMVFKEYSQYESDTTYGKVTKVGSTFDCFEVEREVLYFESGNSVTLDVYVAKIAIVKEYYDFPYK